MKKIIALILSIFIVICFVGCENMFDTNKPDADGAGLYITGTNELLYSWSKMIKKGWVNSDGTVNDGYEDDISGKLVLPSTITSVPDSAFSWCQNLEEIVLHKSVHTIGERAFDTCTALTSLTIPCNIGADAFYFCTNLKTVTILEGVTQIGDSSFYGCESLQTINIPKSLKKLGSKVFAETGNLNIVYNGTRAEWRSIDKPIAHSLTYNEIIKEWDHDAGRYTIKCTDGNINWANEDE